MEANPEFHAIGEGLFVSEAIVIPREGLETLNIFTNESIVALVSTHDEDAIVATLTTNDPDSAHFPFIVAGTEGFMGVMSETHQYSAVITNPSHLKNVSFAVLGSEKGTKLKSKDYPTTINIVVPKGISIAFYSSERRPSLISSETMKAEDISVSTGN